MASLKNSNTSKNVYTPQVVNMGCRLNSLESDLLSENLQDLKHKTPAIIVNTCAVTKEAVRQSQQQIRRISKKNPRSTIIVTGCASQSDNHKFLNMQEVDAIVGNKEKLDSVTIRNILDENTTNSVFLKRTTHSDTISNKLNLVTPDLHKQEAVPSANNLSFTFSDKTRALIQIQQGCNHFCTFCIVPYTRGKSISYSQEAIIQEVHKQVEKGYKEIVLTGIDLTSWGLELNPPQSFSKLISEILRQVPKLYRLRLSSLDPAMIDDELLNCYEKDLRLSNHTHLSMQSGNDLILKRMKRRHNTKDLKRICQDLRRATAQRNISIALGADIIAGFPTETQEMHQSTVELLKELELSFLHVFPYSIRDKTPASKMPQIPQDIRKNRAKEIRMLGERLETNYLNKHLNTTVAIINEHENKGYSSTYCPVHINRNLQMTIGEVYDVRIIDVDTTKKVLIGEPLNEYRNRSE